MSSIEKEIFSLNNKSFSKLNINISFPNNTNPLINNIYNKIEDFYEENKTNELFFKNNKQDQSTQTEPNALYIEEDDDPIITNEIKVNKKRKYSPDLIRDKIFKHFNKMLFNWIIKSKKDNDEIDIISYQFEKNNKQCILESMSKCLKELFISKNQIKEIQNINNELLKYKLEFKYEELYKIFISEPNQIKTENYVDNFLDNFHLLGSFLELLKGKETLEYISKVKDIALNYEKWKNKKIHFTRQYN